jgi:hypothetical protein
MRTTVRIDDELLRRAKQFAARRGRTLAAVIDDALRTFLSEDRATPVRPIRLPTFKGNGLRPGVDLDDSAALLEVMERGR